MLDTTLPMMATPRAPPIWRVVSFTADPTPALSRGSAPMTDSVAGAIVMPIPTAIVQNITMTTAYGDVLVRNDIDVRASVTTQSPNVTTRLVPKRSTNRADSGATVIIVRANGIMRTPAASGL